MIGFEKWQGMRRAAPLGALSGLIVGALLLVALPHREAVDIAFIIDADRNPLASGTSALAGLVGGDIGDRSNSPDFYAYLVTSDEVLYRIACRIAPQPATQCDHDQFDRIALTKAVARLRKRITPSVSRSTGVVSVRVIESTDSAALATGVALLATVDAYHRGIRQSRAGEEYRVALRLRDSVHTELDSAEDRVRAFRETNRGDVGAPRLRLELQRLERRVDLANQVFLSLARDAQEAELRRSRDTPVMTVLQRPRFPTNRISPPGFLKLFAATILLGMVVSIAWVFAAASVRVMVASLFRSGASTKLSA